jgi:hypothetical protein
MGYTNIFENHNVLFTMLAEFETNISDLLQVLLFTETNSSFFHSEYKVCVIYSSQVFNYHSLQLIASLFLNQYLRY